MDCNVIHLAIAGEHLYALKQANLLDIKNIETHVDQLLTTNFSSFPQAIGGGIWFQPYILDETIQYFGAYAFQSDRKVKFS